MSSFVKIVVLVLSFVKIVVLVSFFVKIVVLVFSFIAKLSPAQSNSNSVCWAEIALISTFTQPPFHFLHFQIHEFTLVIFMTIIFLYNRGFFRQPGNLHKISWKLSNLHEKKIGDFWALKTTQNSYEHYYNSKKWELKWQLERYWTTLKSILKYFTTFVKIWIYLTTSWGWAVPSSGQA